MIRRLTPDDQPLLWEMLYHALHVPPGHAPYPRESVHTPQIARYAGGWGRAGDEGYAAIAQGIAIGAVWLRRMTGEQKGYGYVDDATPELSMAVVPEQRGRGIGTQLLAALLDDVDVRGVRISLSVTGSNPAVRLYRRMGFSPVAEVDGAVTMLRPARVRGQTS